jgi:hypothetical protein
MLNDGRENTEFFGWPLFENQTMVGFAILATLSPPCYLTTMARCALIRPVPMPTRIHPRDLPPAIALVELLYAALASPQGILVVFLDFDEGRNELYRTRKKLNDVDLNVLAFKQIKNNPDWASGGNMAIVKMLEPEDLKRAKRVNENPRAQED